VPGADIAEIVCVNQSRAGQSVAEGSELSKVVAHHRRQVILECLHSKLHLLQSETIDYYN